MCGTPKAASRRTVTSSRGLYLRSTSPTTPNVDGLKNVSSVPMSNGRGAESRSRYSGSWSLEWAGRTPAVRNAPRSTAFARPREPGGRMLRTPPASLVPYGGGSGCAPALAGRHMASATAVIRTPLLIADGTLPGDSGSRVVRTLTAEVDAATRPWEGRRIRMMRP
jgi:hypothetical protein